MDTSCGTPSSFCRSAVSGSPKATCRAEVLLLDTSVERSSCLKLVPPVLLMWLNRAPLSCTLGHSVSAIRPVGLEL